MESLQQLFMEDLEVGYERSSQDKLVTEEEIIQFAKEFDPQPFHLDVEEAKETFFGGLAASGWHTAAMTMRLLTEALPLAGGIIGLGGEIAWPTPTRPGDLLHVTATVTAIVPSTSRPDRGVITVEGLTLNQDGEVRERLLARLFVFRRPASVG